MDHRLPSPDSDMVVSCLGNEKTVLEPRPRPMVDSGEMLLRLRVVGFCGTDLFKLTTDSASPGTVLGHEIVGEVIDLGDGVDKFDLGDRVCVPHHVPCGECLYCRRGNETMCETFRENLMEPGGFADSILIKSRATALAAHRIPDDISDAAAVFVEPAACVLRGVERSGIDRDGTAVIQGGGSMGLLHLLVLKAALPGVSVAVIDPLEPRRALAESLGASATAAPGDAALDAVEGLTAGAGADAVFDTVGGSRLLEAGLQLSRQGGTIVLFAHAPDGDRAGFGLNDLFKFERRVLGTYSGALHEQAAVFELIKSGALDPSPLVTHTMPLNDFQRGYSLAKNQEALKILFTPSVSTETT